MNTQEVDYIIVGQGLAGTMMAHFLLKSGASIKVVDQSIPNSSSKVAAGLINPITGKRLVKSWEIEKLIPFAQHTYQELEELLQVKLYYSKKILRVLKNAGDENTWLARTAQAPYQAFLTETGKYGTYAKTNPDFFGVGTITGAAQVDLPLLLDKFRQWLIQNNQLIDAVFEIDKIQFLNEGIGVSYQDIHAKKIIFCEGADAVNNPYFKHLPFQISKGEVILVKFENHDFDEIFKLGPTALIPLPNNQYWLGATNSWSFNDNKPSQEKKELLQKKLTEMISISSKINDHQAAIRPTVKDRRPFLGLHHRLPHLAIFNGLGTKGTSLAPYFANKMVDFLQKNGPLSKEVNIERFR